MKDILDELSKQINHLQECVSKAIEFANQYYDDNIIIRLKSYEDAVKNCSLHFTQIENCLEANNYDQIPELINRIIMISDMIKNDAIDILLTKESGFDDFKNSNMWN